MLRHLVRLFVWGATFALVVLTVAGLWLAEQVARAPLEPLALEAPTSLQVAPGTTARSLLARLEAEGRLTGTWRMRLWLRWRGQGGLIQAGEYLLRPGTTALGLFEDLRLGRVLRHELTLIEGWRFAQVRAALAAHPVLLPDAATLDDAALMAAIGAAGRSPEGLFFPASYAFVRGEGALAVLRRAHERLERELEQAWSGRDPGVDAVLRTPYEALILASLVEKETAAAAERPLIAGVFLRRLALGMRLQTDPTVIFGLGAAFDGDLKRVHLESDGPYNTYTRPGLPPTPIALVGRAALEAAVRPAGGEALYFVARGDGTHEFSESYERHLEFVRRFQGGGRQRLRHPGDPEAGGPERVSP
jgi:UPF0755 protein